MPAVVTGITRSFSPAFVEQRYCNSFRLSQVIAAPFAFMLRQLDIQYCFFTAGGIFHAIYAGYRLAGCWPY